MVQYFLKLFVVIGNILTLAVSNSLFSCKPHENSSTMGNSSVLLRRRLSFRKLKSVTKVTQYFRTELAINLCGLMHYHQTRHPLFTFLEKSLCFLPSWPSQPPKEIFAKKSFYFLSRDPDKDDWEVAVREASKQAQKGSISHLTLTLRTMMPG